MSEQDAKFSDLVEIAKRNGDFRKNYGLIIGAFLYLRSIHAAGGSIFGWRALIAVAISAVAFFQKFG